MNSTIQRILVPLDPSEYTEAATSCACEVARTHYAQLEGLVVLDTPEIRSQIAPVEIAHWPSVVDVVNDALKDAEDVITKTRYDFANHCDAQRVAHAESELEGIPANRILEVSALFDLVVTGLRTFFHFETREGPGDSLAKVLDRTVAPVLAVPKGQQTPFKNVLVAYDGSFDSSRALRDFVGFAKPYEFAIKVFSADKDRSQAEALANRAAAYLRAHNFKDVSTATSDKNPIEAIEHDHLKETDLIVSGIHHRKFLKDAFVSSFTNHLIELDNTALFLSH